jgi:diguanylate cyclase (GGDEF)-like protein
MVMKNRLGKILWFDFFSLLSRHTQLFNDFILSDIYLSLQDKKVLSNIDLNIHLIRAFEKISKFTAIRLDLYGMRHVSPDNWVDLIAKKPLDPKKATFLAQNFITIFQNALGIFKLPVKAKEENNHRSEFLYFKIADEFFYILKINNKKYCNHYYNLFYLIISRVLKYYQDSLERQNLKEQIAVLNKSLLDTERSLQIADKAVKRKVYDLHNLVEASNEIYSILNFKQLINSALLTIIGQLGIQNALALMNDPASHAFSLNFQKGFKDRDVEMLKFKIETPLTKYLLKRGTPLYTQDMEKEYVLSAYTKKLKKIGVTLIAPIINQGRLQGIIGIGEKLYGRSFNQTDYELFHVLINIISISIENALHYEEVKNLSLTDAMTNLHNYRYFSIRLKEELNRSKRSKAKVSLLIIDIDHFKNYNDTLGHQAGDEALRSLGKVLKLAVRDEDIVCRYGGEEFCIILPGISRNSLEILGERLRQKIEVHNFYKERVQPAGRLTVSLGGATFPDDARNPDELIQRADQALYEAKNMGRNQMQLYLNPAIRNVEIPKEINPILSQ